MSSLKLQTAAIALGTTLAAPALAAESRWEIDAGHSSAQFKVRHLMVSHVKGELGPMTGTLFLDDRDVTRSRVEVSIDARGIDTREPKRDEHLRSADFLDVEKHPTVTFKSTKVRRGKGEALEVTGDLTIRGVTRPVTLLVSALSGAVKDPWGNVKRGATGRTTLNRRDFGLTWNMALETGGVVVADKIEVELEVELVQKDGRS